ncbi:MAG TPA: DUF2393 family protein [Edaphobacter sp.]|nr:DUF2393 family protein [Edaphobacter sp.]
MFGNKPSGGGVPAVVWAIAALVVLLVVVGMVLAGHHKSKGPEVTSVQPLAPYAAHLPLSGFAMSESTSLSGGKSTYIDGHIKNTGDATVTSITVQVLFGNGEGTAPHIETMPLTLIRMKQPYVDTQSVGSAPLKPGDERDFRLIFESIPENWNMEMPEVRIVGVQTK